MEWLYLTLERELALGVGDLVPAGCSEDRFPAGRAALGGVEEYQMGVNHCGPSPVFGVENAPENPRGRRLKRQPRGGIYGEGLRSVDPGRNFLLGIGPSVGTWLSGLLCTNFCPGPDVRFG